LLRKAAARPALEVQKRVDAAIVNVIIGNADASVKTSACRDRITAAFLLSLPRFMIWTELPPRFAMTFGGAATMEHGCACSSQERCRAVFQVSAK
jgi:serine/threonine-protein kinase HipA